VPLVEGWEAGSSTSISTGSRRTVAVAGGFATALATTLKLKDENT